MYVSLPEPENFSLIDTRCRKVGLDANAPC
jgi:hypothetical protein